MCSGPPVTPWKSRVSSLWASAASRLRFGDSGGFVGQRLSVVGTESWGFVGLRALRQNRTGIQVLA